MSTYAEDFFPFTLSPYDNGNFIEMPRQYQGIFMKHRPPKKSWYAYGVTVESPTRITFKVYGMKDMFHGGIDYADTYEFSVDVTEADTKKDIIERAMGRAVARRQDELDAAEALIIGGYAVELLTELGLAATYEELDRV